MARNWLARGGLTSKALPPFWFVGLHETLAGSVVDTLPRTPARHVRLCRTGESTRLGCGAGPNARRGGTNAPICIAACGRSITSWRGWRLRRWSSSAS